MAKKTTRARKRRTTKRELIDTGRNKMYAKRTADGQLKEMDDVGRPLSADRRKEREDGREGGTRGSR